MKVVGYFRKSSILDGWLGTESPLLWTFDTANLILLEKMNQDSILLNFNRGLWLTGNECSYLVCVRQFLIFSISFLNHRAVDRYTNDWTVKDRGGSRTTATSKMERFVIIVNGFHLGCCSSPRTASERENVHVRF